MALSGFDLLSELSNPLGHYSLYSAVFCSHSSYIIQDNNTEKFRVAYLSKDWRQWWGGGRKGRNRKSWLLIKLLFFCQKVFLDSWFPIKKWRTINVSVWVRKSVKQYTKVFAPLILFLWQNSKRLRITRYIILSHKCWREFCEGNSLFCRPQGEAGPLEKCPFKLLARAPQCLKITKKVSF